MLNPEKILVVVMLAVATACGAVEPLWYAGTSGGLLLPGNGNSALRGGEVTARTGFYASDSLAWEVDASCAPNISTGEGREALSGVAARGLFHLAGIEAFDKLFGCERLDPFVTLGGGVRFGARHAFADDSHRTAIGPVAGGGVFYHLTESLDLRLDAQSMLCCDSPCGMLYSISFGLQWNFGGGGE